MATRKNRHNSKRSISGVLKNRTFHINVLKLRDQRQFICFRLLNIYNYLPLFRLTFNNLQFGIDTSLLHTWNAHMMQSLQHYVGRLCYYFKWIRTDNFPDMTCFNASATILNLFPKNRMPLSLVMHS